MRGKLITFEGAEGSGKTTQCRIAYDYLRRRRWPVFLVREPGGVKISEAVRKILLDARNVRMSDECEVLLYMAARAQLVSEVIAPALKKGKIVLCDRFLDSTLAYQGYGNGVAISKIKAIGRFATLGVAPELTLVFDIDARRGLARRGKNRDRIERPVLYAPEHDFADRHRLLGIGNDKRARGCLLRAETGNRYQACRTKKIDYRYRGVRHH